MCKARDNSANPRLRARSGTSGRRTRADRCGRVTRENFPVGSVLIAPRHRSAVLAFYRFARAADDVADDPAMPTPAKLSRLDRFAAGLDGDPSGAPEALALGGAARTEGRALLGAFRQDARGAEYETWDDLAAYCAMSAVPVGRFLLALHSGPADATGYADALCTALQVLNHLQDLGPDHVGLGRCYMPGDWRRAAGAALTDLGAPALTPAWRSVADRALDRCDALLAAAAPLPAALADRRLAGESRATLHLARGLAAALRRGDPLARRIRPSRSAFFGAGLRGLAEVLRPRPRRPLPMPSGA